jgi:hypothetical protein
MALPGVMDTYDQVTAWPDLMGYSWKETVNLEERPYSMIGQSS